MPNSRKRARAVDARVEKKARLDAEESNASDAESTLTEEFEAVDDLDEAASTLEEHADHSSPSACPPATTKVSDSGTSAANDRDATAPPVDEASLGTSDVPVNSPEAREALVDSPEAPVDSPEASSPKTTVKTSGKRSSSTRPHAKTAGAKIVTMKDGVTRPAIVRVLKAIAQSDLSLSEAELEYFDDMIERIIPMLNFKDVKTNRFAVGTIPFNIDWGTEQLGADMDRYIMHGKTRLAAWFIGIVTTVWLCPRSGTRINIGLKLLCQRDHDTARQLQYDWSSPAGDPSTAGQTVFCSRFLSTRAEEGGSFEEVYDAQDRLLPWGQMHQIDPARVQKTDLVLVECYIKRFKSRDRAKSKTWSSWAVNFDILRIAYLAAGPGAAGDIVPDDCDVNL